MVWRVCEWRFSKKQYANSILKWKTYVSLKTFTVEELLFEACCKLLVFA